MRSSLLLALAFLLVSASQAHGMALSVRTNADGFDSCVAPSSNCSLRTALANANASAEGDTINLNGRTIVLTVNDAGAEDAPSEDTGDLDYIGNGDLHIFNGTIEAGPAFTSRILHQHGGKLTLSNVTIRGGTAPLVGNGISLGGGIYVGSGQSLLLTNSTVIDNFAPQGGRGGGISIGSGIDAKIENSFIQDNRARNGGGIYSHSPLTLDRTIVSGNSALSDGAGGGIESHNKLTVIRSRVTGNAADDFGGGIAAYLNEQLTEISRSTIDGNSAKLYGAGIANGAPAIISESTFANNEVVEGPFATGGGGISHGGPKTLQLRGVTVAGNRAQEGQQMHIAGNTIASRVLVVGECTLTPSGTVSAFGSVETGFGCGFVGDANRRGASVRLSPFTTDLHQTPVFQLLGQSDAIDVGKSFSCENNPIDQLGISRIEGECDAGATEALKTDHTVALTMPAQSPAGARFAAQIEVRNLGPRADTGVAARLILPAGVQFDGGPCSGSGEIVCSVGALAPGETKTVPVELRTSTPGTSVITAGLFSDLAELTPGDESPSRAITITSPSPAADTTAPSLQVTLSRKLSRRKLAKSRRLPVKLTASERCTAEIVARAGKVALSKAKGKALAAGPNTLRLKLSKKAAKRVRKAKSIDVLVACADAAGNSGRATGKVRLRA